MTRSLWLDISGTTVLGCLLGCGRVLIFLLLRSISLFRFSVLKLSLQRYGRYICFEGIRVSLPARCPSLCRLARNCCHVAGVEKMYHAFC